MADGLINTKQNYKKSRRGKVVFPRWIAILMFNLILGTGDPGGKPYHSRKDSWDAIEKTRQMMSANR